VRYEPDGEGGLASTADYGYGYREALRDGVVRPVVFAPTPASRAGATARAR
jgi:hypothetical protein